MRHPRQARHHHAQGHPAGTPHPWRALLSAQPVKSVAPSAVPEILNKEKNKKRSTPVFINTTTSQDTLFSLGGVGGKGKVKDGGALLGYLPGHPRVVCLCGECWGRREEGREGGGGGKQREGGREGVLSLASVAATPLHPPKRKGVRNKTKGKEAFEEEVVLINTGGRSFFLLLLTPSLLKGGELTLCARVQGT